MIVDNIPVLSAEEFIDMETSILSAAIQKNVPLKTLPSVFLSSAPGVGKSSSVFQVAEKLSDAVGKKVLVTDIRLLLFSPIDLRGVPMEDKTGRFTEWKMPRLFDLDPGKDVVNILFLDELTAAAPAVQAAAYQITLNRAIGEFHLPDNCVVMGAGNRITDRSVTYRMPQALANRMMHFQLKADFESWRRWAIGHGVNEYVLGYLSYDSGKLFTEDPRIEETAYPTPRSWMFVSDQLNLLEAEPSNAHAVISACIGTGTALEFEAWSRVHRDLPPIEDILNGFPAPMPRTPDALYAVISALTVRIQREGEKNTKKTLGNVCRYASLFPPDFQALFYRNLLDIPSVALRLYLIPEAAKWLKK